MPNALIEAMCLGLPCISTDVSGASDLITSGKNGEIVDVGDTQELAARMRMLLANDDVRNKFAASAVKLNETLNVQGIVRQWIQYLDSVCRR